MYYLFYIDLFFQKNPPFKYGFMVKVLYLGIKIYFRDRKYTINK